MHYHTEVWIRKKLSISDSRQERLIERILEPYYEDVEDFKGNCLPLFDWYYIGGSWTGAHDGYDVASDPTNFETCYICNGTDSRDMVWYDIDNKRRFKDEFAEKCNGCNACGGTGKIMKHSYDLEKHEEDVMAVSDIPDNFKCYYLIVNENVFISKKQAQDEKSDFYFDGNVKKKLNKLGITDGYLVTVDLHSGEKET